MEVIHIKYAENQICSPHKSITFSFISENKYKIFFVALIYLVSIITIGLANYPYIDDASRQLIGDTSFASSYSRWGSEIASWIVQGSRHLTDMGLTTHILTAIILTTSSIIAVYVLNDKRLDWIPLLCSIFIGINPWFLECVSFRFDSPYMALSILSSFIPFLYWNSNLKKYLLASIIGIFLMCNTYQSSSGIYIVMVLALVFKDITSNKNTTIIVKKILFSIAAYVLTMAAYTVEVNLNLNVTKGSDTTQVAALRDLSMVIPRNIASYFNVYINESAQIWTVLFVLLIVLFIISYLFNLKSNFIKNVVCTFIYLVLGAILSYGVYLIFATDLSSTYPHPRYYFGFAVFAGITLILLSTKKTFKPINMISNMLICVFMYYIISFSFTYSSTLSYQKDAFERQSVILAADLKNMLTKEEETTIYVNTLFSDSKVFNNSVRNYPILLDLVPSNSMVYFPNCCWFNTCSNLNVKFHGFDFSNFDFKHEKLQVSNCYYDIFTKDGSIYIFMK